jgi:very-short-patch-repair endonuclease
LAGGKDREAVRVGITADAPVLAVVLSLFLFYPLAVQTREQILRARALRKTLTPQELRLWLELRTLRAAGAPFRRQAPFREFTLDFVCLDRRLVVEVDGGHHAEARQSERDAVRDAILRREGYAVLRFTNGDVNTNLDGVMATVRAALARSPSQRDIRAFKAPTGGSR